MEVLVSSVDWLRQIAVCCMQSVIYNYRDAVVYYCTRAGDTIYSLVYTCMWPG